MKVSKLLTQQPGRNPFERCDQIRQRHFWRVIDQQMHMIMLAVEFHQLGIKILTHACHDQVHSIKVLSLEHITPIFCYEYQMNMKREGTVSPMAKFAVYYAWTRHNYLLH